MSTRSLVLLETAGLYQRVLKLLHGRSVEIVAESPRRRALSAVDIPADLRREVQDMGAVVQDETRFEVDVNG